MYRFTPTSTAILRVDNNRCGGCGDAGNGTLYTAGGKGSGVAALENNLAVAQKVNKHICYFMTQHFPF